MLPSASRSAEYIGTGGGVLALLAFGLANATEVQSLTIDLLAVTVRFVFLEALSAAAVFTFFVGLTGLLLVREVWSSRDDLEQATDGPR